MRWTARTYQLFVVALLLSMLTLSPVARAQSDAPDDSPTTIPRGAVAIGDGFAFTAAVVNPLPSGPTRTMNAYQAAVFVQSWLADAFFGHPTAQDPPPTASTFRVDVTGLWGDSTGTLAVYYASDGTSAWISFPQDQSPASPPPQPPAPNNWFIAASAVIPAFAGTAKLATTTTVATEDTAAVSIRSSDLVAPKPSDHRMYWFAGAAVLVVLAAVSVGRERMRRKRKEDEAAAVRVPA